MDRRLVAEDMNLITWNHGQGSRALRERRAHATEDHSTRSISRSILTLRNGIGDAVDAAFTVWRMGMWSMAFLSARCAPRSDCGLPSAREGRMVRKQATLLRRHWRIGPRERGGEVTQHRETFSCRAGRVKVSLSMPSLARSLLGHCSAACAGLGGLGTLDTEPRGLGSTVQTPVGTLTTLGACS